MKNIRLLAVGLLLTLSLAGAALGQSKAGNKVFVIDTGEFTNPKSGITKFANAFKQLDKVMDAQSKALVGLDKKIKTAAKEYQTLRTAYEKNPNGPVTALAVKRKAEDIEQMQIRLKRDQEDYKLALTKNEKEIFDPIRIDIYKVLDKFAKEKGYPIILDLVQMVDTKLVLAIGDKRVDLTQEFISYYNAQSGTAK